MSGQGISTATEEKALNLLGAGVSPEQVAFAVGVTASRISQLLSQDEFALKVAELRYKNLAKHNEHDNEVDDLEIKIFEKLKMSLEYVFQPMQLLKVLKELNSLKRRGQSTPEAITAQQTVLTLNIPTVIINKFTTNINNQVTEAGDQKLVTIQSGTLMDRIKAAAASVNKGITIEHEPQRLATDREVSSSRS